MLRDQAKPGEVSLDNLPVIHRLGTKFIGGSILLLIVFGLMGYFILNFNQENFLDKELQTKAGAVARVLAAHISGNFARGDYAGVQKELELMKTLEPEIVYIYVRDTSGNVVARASSLVSVTPNPLSKDQAISYRRFFVKLDSTEQEVIDAGVRVIPEQKAELHVGVRTEVQNYLYSKILKFTLMALIMIVLGVFFMRYITLSQVINPVRELLDLAHRVKKGNLGQKAEITAMNEIGLLGHALNEMMEHIQQQKQAGARAEEAMNTIQSHILNMLNIVAAAAQGDLTKEAEVTADVLGSLADAFNLMITGLASLVEQVRDAAGDIGSATTQILAAVPHMLKGAEEQRVHINNTSSAVDEISISMQQVSNNAEAASQASQRATEAAQKGEKSVAETIKGMHRIRNTVQVTSKKIKSLGDRSLEIGEIVEVIDDIASQTNLLALNAAIEAARAGEHGRGFAVVAEEVRKLAERSSKATENIAELIKGIQAETTEAVRAMEEGTREVEEGTRLADIAGASLKEIDKIVGQVADLIHEISLAAKQQVRGTEGVVKSMESISDITAQHVEFVRQTTETIKQLATLSDRLTEAIGRFKLRERDPRFLPRASREKIASPSTTSLAEEDQGFGEDSDDEDLITDKDFGI
jgi:methyl-accepting chemotaxis protein